MKYIKLIYVLLIEAPLFYLGYCFEALWSAVGAGRTAYVKGLMNDDEVGEFLKWRKTNRKKLEECLYKNRNNKDKAEIL